MITAPTETSVGGRNGKYLRNEAETFFA